MQAHSQKRYYCQGSGPHLEINDSCTVCTNLSNAILHFVVFLNLLHELTFSLQQVLGLTTLDGVLNPAHVKGKYIVHNVFNINKSGIVVLENNDGNGPGLTSTLDVMKNLTIIRLIPSSQMTCPTG